MLAWRDVSKQTVIGIAWAHILLLPFFVAVASLVSLAWLVDYGTQRQVPGFSLRNSVSRLVRAGIYVFPHGFSSNVVPDQWRLVYSLNPTIDVIDGFRWCILGEQNQLYLPGFGLSP